MKKCKGKVGECRGYKTALSQICDILNGWKNGDFVVFAADNTDVDEDTVFTLDYRLATIHNIVLAALGKPELVPGIPDQSFKVIVPTD